MVSADYRCAACGKVVERRSDEFVDGLPELIHSMCDERGQMATLRRVWSPPHLGPGSSQEPVR